MILYYYYAYYVYCSVYYVYYYYYCYCLQIIYITMDLMAINISNLSFPQTISVFAMLYAFSN